MSTASFSDIRVVSRFASDNAEDDADNVDGDATADDAADANVNDPCFGSIYIYIYIYIYIERYDRSPSNRRDRYSVSIRT
jgi:hypothetical protein